MKGLKAEIAGAFIEQASNHVADAGLAAWVLGRATAEGIFHRNQRDSGILQEPGFDTTRRDQALDLGRGKRPGGGKRI